MSFRHLSYILSGAAVLLLSATACTQDEPADGTRLPEGEYPLIINATGLSVEAMPQATSASTRSTVDGNWDGVTSVALSLGSETKEYEVTASATDGYKTATLSNNLSPFWWTSRNDITVSAWWPCKDGEDNFLTTMPAVVVKADQSTVNDFAASDFISAENQTVQFDHPMLEFSHRTARITVLLKPGDGIPSVTGANVSVTGLGTDNGNPATIKTYAPDGDTYEALTAPQTVKANTPFIQVDLGIGTYYFRPQSDVELVANSRYIYTINVNATGLTLAGCTIGEWADGGREEGTAEDLGYFIQDDGSYAVYTATGLQAWATEMINDATQNLNCTLTADIDLTGTEWTPIPKFAGTFDGNGKTITGLTINQSTTDNVGLFASITEGGTVKNLTLDDVNITASSSNVGAIAGENRGTIENCSVSGSVTGSSDNSCVGGIAGWHREGTITDCHSSATVEGKAYVGGIAGQSSAIVGTTTITACYSTGSVTATTNSNYYSYAGGVVGLNSNGTVLTACYATGDVKGDGDCVGGVVGDNVVGTVTACYHATGDVTSVSSSTGGVAGRNYADQYGGPGTITACYWNGTVSYDRGIGNDVLLAGGATKVEGSTTWETAMNAMNMALTNAGTDWRYVTGSGDVPLKLQKQ